MAVTIYTGAPADAALRPEAEGRCYAFLNRQGIPFLRAEHPDAADYTVRQEIETALSATACKNLFLQDSSGEHFYLLMLPSFCRMDSGALSAQLGVPHLRLASDEALFRLLGVHQGAVSAMALLNPAAGPVELLAEARVLEAPQFLAHPCVPTVTLSMSTKDFLGVFLPALGRETPRTVRFA